MLRLLAARRSAVRIAFLVIESIDRQVADPVVVTARMRNSPLAGKRASLPRSSRAAAKNRLVDGLPSQDRERLLAVCEQVELKFGEALREPERQIRYVLFPTGSSISVITGLDRETSLVVALVGDEGMLGASVAFGLNESPQSALVNGSGTAWRIEAAPFCLEFERSLPLRRVIGRYLYAVMAQLSQTAVCAHFHDVDARLARWLLMTGDRAHSDQFYITQEFISAMLGVRREGVNQAASLLRERKLIRYSRGELTILDRRGLQTAACLCYAVDKNTYTKILG